MHLVPGRLVGRFGIEARLGAGASAQVFRVRDRRSGALRALKVLSAPTADQRARFDRELALLQQVEHPNVVGVEGVVEVGGSTAMVLKYVAGPSLAEALRAGSLTPAEANTIARGVMAGVGALHAVGVVHRDLKPANILLAREGERLVPKVADLGVARRFQPGPQMRLTRTGDALGTPAYMAPEQLRDSSRVGPPADIWALGVLLFEMVCGQRPFSGRTLQEVAAAIERGPPDPRFLFSDLPAAWEVVLRAALQVDPNHRPSAETLATLWRGEDASALPAHLPASESGADEPLSTLALGEPTLAPASTDVRTARHNLPWEADAFIGREDELAALAEMLATGGNQVTVTGTGGVGKTRLVQRLAWERLDDWPGGAWFCDLSAARSPAGICYAVAQALDVPLNARQDPVVQLGYAIDGRGRCLVLLDNFEQVVEHAEATLGWWRAHTGEAVFVVTSREALGLPGEHRLALEPLALPPETACSASAVRATAAGALFVERAAQAQPGFALTGDIAPEVAALVRSLDGLPLAIELAAARTRLLTPAQMLARMRQRFRLLASPRGQQTTRQATLQATLEWSWALLTPWEQAAFAQCSVFEGGFTLDAAEAVLDLSRWAIVPEAKPVLRSLLEKSLLRMWLPATRTGVAPEPRFGMFRSLQAFAGERLLDPARGEADWQATAEERAARRRHQVYFAGFGSEEALVSLHRSGGASRFWALTREFDNLMTACRRAIAGEKAISAVATALATAEVLLLRGPLKVAFDLLSEVLETIEPSGRDRVRLLSCLGRIDRLTAQPQRSRRWLERALQLAVEGGYRRLEARILGTLGILQQDQGHTEAAQVRYEAALATHREVGARSGEGAVRSNLGGLFRRLGQVDTAQEHYEAALAIYRELEDCHREAHVLINLGNLYGQKGRLDTAREHYEVALTLYREVGDRRGEGHVRSSLGQVAFRQSRMDSAQEHYAKALIVHREVGLPRFEGAVLSNLGLLHQSQGRLDSAQACYEAALIINRALKNRRLAASVQGNLGNLCAQQGRPRAAWRHYEEALAVHREVSDRRREGIALSNMGNLHRRCGEVDAARACLDAALSIHREVGDRRSEGIALNCLGLLHHGQGRLDSAWEHIEASLAIHREASDRRREGIALTHLGELETDRGHAENAASYLAQGETLLREVGAHRRLGRLLCARGQLQLRQGHLPGAADTLAEATALAQSVSAGATSDLGCAVAKLREALAAKSP